MMSVPVSQQDAQRPSLSAWLRLIRWPNLLIIFFTQAAVWTCVIQPLGESSLVLDRYYFLLLSASTVAIAAAGYLINDYFDIRIDAVNHPEKFILEKKIHRRIAIILHSALNALGLFLALIAARRTGSYWPVFLPIVCTALLWFYSTHFKQRFMVGNIVVALLTALAVLTLLVYEPAVRHCLSAPLFSYTGRKFGAARLNPAYVLCTMGYFAFLLTWIREVVKDMEDLKGDSAEGCTTMPIRWGLLRTTRFVQGLSVLTLLPLLYAVYRLLLADLQFTYRYLVYYLLGFVVLPLLIWTVRLPRRATNAHYKSMSRWIKIITVLGVASLAFVRYRHA